MGATLGYNIVMANEQRRLARPFSADTMDFCGDGQAFDAIGTVNIAGAEFAAGAACTRDVGEVRGIFGAGAFFVGSDGSWLDAGYCAFFCDARWRAGEIAARRSL